MRFRTRLLLLWMLPVAVLMSVSFLTIQAMVQTRLRDGLRQSIRDNLRAVSSVRAALEGREKKLLSIAGENSALKASLQLALLQRGNPAALATLEDQLRDLGERMGVDLLIAATDDGGPLTGVVRSSGILTRLPGMATPKPEADSERSGLFSIGQEIYKSVWIPVELSGETLAALVVGMRFDLSSEFSPAVLLRDGKVVRSSVPGASPQALEIALLGCHPQTECDIRLDGVGYSSLPLRLKGLAATSADYTLLSLQSTDASLVPLMAGLRWTFFAIFWIAAALVAVCAVIGSRSAVAPIHRLIANLGNAEGTGQPGEPNPTGSSGIAEIDELMRSFNRAAAAATTARANLEAAYAQFAGSLAKALDSRDRYTASHSQRVSELSCIIAAALDLPKTEVDRVRMGALLHDIGKIGVSDTVLLKPGRLTDAEAAMIRRHPEIGRRILEKVEGFSDWLDAVELHHENWDGSGYPHGLKSETVPLDARIIRVADAYDSMTSDRPYKRGIKHENALLALRAGAGTYFDPHIVNCLIGLPGVWGTQSQSTLPVLEREAATISFGQTAETCS